MKVKIFHDFNAENLEKKVQDFLDTISNMEENFHIMDFNLTANDKGWAASLLYMQVPNTQQGEEDGRPETEHHGG